MIMKRTLLSVTFLLVASMALVGCPTQVSVPDVVGLTQLAATDALVNAGFLVSVTLAHNDTVTQGDVISQNPVAATQAASGSTITITVSEGPATGVVVPQIVGMTVAEATTALQAVALALGAQTTQSSSTVPVGKIISQNPLTGTNVLAGALVNVVVSSGPPTVAIPNLVGKSTLEAVVLLNQLQLTVGTITYQISGQPAGIVISQSPASGGAQVLLGTVVNIVASSGPTTVQVPVLIGLTQAQATAALSAIGLVLGNVSQQFDSANIGKVIEQGISAGDSVPIGSEVTLTLGCAAPNVVGMTKAQAISTLAAVGITCVDPANITQAVLVTPAIGVVTAQNVVGNVATLTVSSRAIPALAGMTKTQVSAALTNGLSLGAVSYTPIAVPTNAGQIATIGKFASSVPVPGTVVSDATVVTAAFYTTVAPNILNMTAANANTAITNYGLTRFENGYVATTDASKVNKVATQDPAAGQPMPADASGTINKVVTIKYYGILLPNVMGLNENTAMTQLNALAPGLMVVALTHNNLAQTDSQFAKIDSESPAAGTVIGIKGGGLTDVTLDAYGLDVASRIGVDLIAGTTSEALALNVLANIKPASGLTPIPYTRTYTDSSGGNEAKFGLLKTITLNDTVSNYCTSVALNIYGAPIANYVGMTQAAAQNAVTVLQGTYPAFPNATLKYVLATVVTEMGDVVAQNPVGPGVGTSVTLSIGSGVLDVTGMDVLDSGVAPNVIKGALSLLTDLGLAPTAVWMNGGAVSIGKVINTVPAANTFVAAGTTVTVNGSGVLVPVYTGLTVANAIAAINANPNLVSAPGNDYLVPTATVTTQNKVAGTYVAPGTVITLGTL